TINHIHIIHLALLLFPFLLQQFCLCLPYYLLQAVLSFLSSLILLLLRCIIFEFNHLLIFPCYSLLDYLYTLPHLSANILSNLFSHSVLSSFANSTVLANPCAKNSSGFLGL